MAAATAATQLPEGRLEKWRASTVRLPAATRLLAAAYRDFGPVQFAWDGEPAAVQAAGLAWLAGTLVERAAYWAQATVYTYLVDRRADPVAMAVLSRRQADSTLARLDAVPWFGRFVTGYATAPYKLGWRTYTRWTAYTDLCATMAAADMAAHAAEGYWVIELVATEPSFRGQGITPHILSAAIADVVSNEAHLPIYAIVTAVDHMRRFQQFGFEAVSQATVPGSSSSSSSRPGAAAGGATTMDDDDDAGGVVCWGMVRRPVPLDQLVRRTSALSTSI